MKMEKRKEDDKKAPGRRRPYSAPALTIHGTVEKITKAATATGNKETHPVRPGSKIV